MRPRLRLLQFCLAGHGLEYSDNRRIWVFGLGRVSLSACPIKGNILHAGMGSVSYLDTCISSRYTFNMIQSTKGKRAANAVQGYYGKGFPSDLVKRSRAMLTALDAAVAVEDLRFPPGNHLEELKGNRAGQHSVRINGQWRICFFWTATGPTDVEIVDYH